MFMFRAETKWTRKLLAGMLAGMLALAGCTRAPEAASAAPETASATATAVVHDPTYESRKAVNEEYVGELTVGDSLVHENVVQGKDNEQYLNEAWDHTASTHGAAFMDYRNTLDDQNIIIYGHYVYHDTSKMFTPLEKLTDRSNYEANKNITLTLDGVTRNYLITDVYYYVMNDNTMMYYNTSYDAEYFKVYYAAVKSADFYDTGEKLTLDDHWLTLQTCVRDHDELREIVLARQVN